MRLEERPASSFFQRIPAISATPRSFLAAILEGVFTVPGDGFIDYFALARRLADIGYEGWVVVEAEQDPAKAPPGAYSAMGRRHLAQAFDTAGFQILEGSA